MEGISPHQIDLRGRSQVVFLVSDGIPNLFVEGKIVSLKLDRFIGFKWAGKLRAGVRQLSVSLLL